VARDPSLLRPLLVDRDLLGVRDLTLLDRDRDRGLLGLRDFALLDRDRDLRGLRDFLLDLDRRRFELRDLLLLDVFPELRFFGVLLLSLVPRWSNSSLI